MIIESYKKQVTVTALCSWVGLSKSVYYYVPSAQKRGRKASEFTVCGQETVSNDVVLEDIREILSGPFNCYGYENVTVELKRKHYLINKKKVYRLMNENNLLLEK